MDYLKELKHGIENKENSMRVSYDYLIDYFSEYKCFLSMSGKPCMFESYGTIIDFEALLKAWNELSFSQRQKALEILKGCVYTPLAFVITSFLEKQRLMSNE